ncbi:MAG: type II secretion system protein [Candidatus Omnitrophica bacterium]|nr:type II secretion system protein [Candidatus Omnitrophota bacterium]
MRLIQKSPRRKPRAFTLIELIMTIVVISIVALPISVTMAKHVQSVFQSQDITMAINLARLDLEQVNNTPYNSIASANIPNYQGYGYDLVRTVYFINGSTYSQESTKKITVQVSKAGSATVLAKLVTYISKNIRYPF